MTHIKKEKGDIATIKAMSDLTTKGYFVFSPVVSEHLPFDFIAYKDYTSLRIQSKYSSDGFVRNKTSWNDKNGTHEKYYDENDFDYYAIYLPVIDKIVYPSIKYGGCTIAYEIHNSATPFYWWEDFIFPNKEEKQKRTYKDFGVELGYKSNPFFIKGSKERLKADIKMMKVQRPSKKELEKLIWEKPMSKIAKDFGVCDKIIAKWISYYNIEKPKKGYWIKK